MSFFEIITKYRTISVLFFNLIFFSIITINAAPGDLDRAFGLSGTVVTPLTGNSIDTISDSITQPDGKIIVVGTRQSTPFDSTTDDTVVIRYNQDGKLDTSFGSGGIKIIAVSSGSQDGAAAVAVQPDGKIIVAGTTFTPVTTYYDFYLLRFNENGTEDFGFGNGGKVVTTFNGTSRDLLADMILQPDGKIVAVGRTSPETGYFEIAAARYNSDGSLDNTFGTGGKMVQIFGIGDDGASDVDLQADGKIVILAVKSSTVISNTIILRYNTDGSLDTTFDQDGYLVVSDISLNHLVIQPDGKYLTAGTTRNSPSDLAVARFNTDGTPDTALDGDGKFITSIGASDETPSDLLLQSDGKVLVSGAYVVDTVTTRAFIVRLNGDGTFDSGFGSAGKVTNIAAAGKRLALQPDGGIITAGSIIYQQANGTDIALNRFTATGAADINFGLVGFSYATVANGSALTKAMIIQPDNKIVVAGELQNTSGTNTNFLVGRFQPDGMLDTAFGNGTGYVSVSLNALDDGAYAVAIQPDGKIIAAGYSGRFPNADIAVVRFNPNGSVDNSFGTNGRQIIQLSAGGADVVTSVLIQPDGKIVLVGYTVVTGGVDFAVLRLTTAGQLDNTFSDDGIVTTPVGSNLNFARTGILQPDGKIIAAGDSSGGTIIGDFALARFNTDGSLDATFGNGGKAFTPLTPSQSDEAYDIALQPDGKIVLAGIMQANPQDIRVSRYNANGTVDTSFGNGGFVRTDIQGSVDSADSVVIQPNGKIVVVGTTGASSEYDFAVVRYDATGALDTSFGNNGVVVNEYGNRGETFSAAALQSNGKLVAAGGINLANSRSIALSRYLLDSNTIFDFDGDGKTDVGIYRPSTGAWWISRSASNTVAVAFGNSTDKIVPADFTGDGKSDIAVFRESSGQWLVLRSEDNTFYGFPFGTSGDKAVPADFDGDGKADPTVFRSSNSGWYSILSTTGAITSRTFGVAEDVPLPNDYDGDGKADLGVFRPSTGVWWMLRSSNNTTLAAAFGTSSDKPTPADFTGDGKTDFAFFRPSTGTWYVIRSEDFSFYGFPFGTSGDTPVAGDYDGDGKADAAVFRDSNSGWYISRSSQGFISLTFGTTGDKPVPSAYLP